jgi:hypothetical protein
LNRQDAKIAKMKTLKNKLCADEFDMGLLGDLGVLAVNPDGLFQIPIKPRK